MNKIFLLLLSAALLASCSSSQDLQDTQYRLKSTMSELTDVKRSLSDCEKKGQNFDKNAEELKGMLDESFSEKNNLTSELEYTREQLASVTRQMEASSDDYGVWFRVQIGAYEDRSIDNELDTTDGLELEGSDVQKVSLGRFREYDKAKRLQDHLKLMGVTDAWVVTYQDGKRVPIDSVMKK